MLCTKGEKQWTYHLLSILCSFLINLFLWWPEDGGYIWSNTEFCEHYPFSKDIYFKSQNRKFQAIETHQYICLKIFWNNKTVHAYPGKQTIIKADVLLTSTSEKHIVNLVNILWSFE